MFQNYFNHKSYPSFVRQLNKYGFEKVNNSPFDVYRNMDFQRDKKEEMGKILSHYHQRMSKPESLIESSTLGDQALTSESVDGEDEADPEAEELEMKTKAFERDVGCHNPVCQHQEEGGQIGDCLHRVQRSEQENIQRFGRSIGGITKAKVVHPYQGITSTESLN